MISMTAYPFTSKMTFNESGWPTLDRAVGSAVLRRLTKTFFTDGVCGIADSTCLQVTAPADGSAIVLVRPGTGLIQGVTGYTEKVESLELTAGDSNLPRIDTVVCRINDNSDYRNMYLDIINGTPGSIPIAPTLTRTGSVWEIGLANLYRRAGSTTITDSDISDTRQDSDRCGYVTPIDRLDTASLMRQFYAFYQEYMDKANASLEEFKQNGTDAYDELFNYLTELTSRAQGMHNTYQDDLRDFYRDITSQGQQKYDSFSAGINEYIKDLQNRGDTTLAAIVQQMLDFRNAHETEFLEFLQEMEDKLREYPPGEFQLELDQLKAQQEDMMEMMLTGMTYTKLITDDGNYIVDDKGKPILISSPICTCKA